MEDKRSVYAVTDKHMPINFYSDGSVEVEYNEYNECCDTQLTIKDAQGIIEILLQFVDDRNVITTLEEFIAHSEKTSDAANQPKGE